MPTYTTGQRLCTGERSHASAVYRPESVTIARSIASLATLAPRRRPCSKSQRYAALYPAARATALRVRPAFSRRFRRAAPSARRSTSNPEPLHRLHNIISNRRCTPVVLNAPLPVELRTYGFKVVRVHAVDRAAGVIDLKVIAQLTVVNEVGDPVRGDGVPLEPEAPVALGLVGAEPAPALFRHPPVDLVMEPLTVGHNEGIEIDGHDPVHSARVSPPMNELHRGQRFVPISMPDRPRWYPQRQVSL